MDESGEKKIKISVRNLVEFVLRSGDIDNRRGQGREKEAMQAGSRLHRKIQRRMGPEYRPEVPLKFTVAEDQFEILVEGRADGIITQGKEVTIDEIKGVYQDVAGIKEPEEVHLAQARCYGYFYCVQNQLDYITIQITYGNIDTEEIKRFQEERSYEELKDWFQGLIHEYVKWARYLYFHGLRRDQSIKDMEFPFTYREGQKILAGTVYRSIEKGERLFIQAPTGIGKTIATIYPSLKAMGDGYGDKLFYLTAKTITRSVAESTFHMLGERGLYFSSVTITAKEKLCILEQPQCNPDSCPRAKGHFDRVNDAVYDIIHSKREITREAILEYGEKHCVCPFEFCLDITSWCDGIICDYNYVFDPNVRLKRYFGEKSHGEYLFLIDEAHNLVSRAREMYSETLVKEEILLAKKIIKNRSPKLVKLLERCNKLMLEMKRQGGEVTVLPDIHLLAVAAQSALGEMEKFMEENQEFQDRELVLDFYFKLRNFMYIHEAADENYQIYSQLDKDGQFSVRLFCVNPAANLSSCLDQGNAAVFFSATLLPVNYYKELLSGNTENPAIYAKSPFCQDNRLLIMASDVSSRYSRRNAREYGKVAEYIKKIVNGKTGNYMVFFPSYQYMAQIDELLRQEPQKFQWMIQQSRMAEEEREDFLSQFDQKRDQSFAGFCVMGGLFSEGIDLTEDRLIGAVLVGTGLPMVCAEQEILRNYFEEKKGDGFRFAYQYPGMNKVLQAAGRVIRTPKDTGIIALLDNRFLGNEYRQLFPLEWQDCQIVNENSVDKALKEFWKKHGADH